MQKPTHNLQFWFSIPKTILSCETINMWAQLQIANLWNIFEWILAGFFLLLLMFGYMPGAPIAFYLTHTGRKWEQKAILLRNIVIKK